MKKEQFETITQWQNKTFKKATALSKIAHLKEEIEELVIDLQNNNISKKQEFADCFILLFGAAASDGMTYEDICNEIDLKMEINHQRKWGKPNDDGVVNHIRK
ncbi:MAG: dATP/dGTP pyrophosphohydrolase domain-containing protein [Bacteroidia bacterium]